MNTILRDVIECHVWANETLLVFCEEMNPENPEVLRLHGEAWRTIVERWPDDHPIT